MRSTRKNPTAGDVAIARLLDAVDQAFDKKAWHGTNLRGAIRGLSAAQAAWRPGAGRHNIWELTVHAAYWKYAVWRRLSGGPRGSFALRGSNWFVRPAPAEPAVEAAWRGDVKLLEESHAALRARIAGLHPGQLERRAKGSRQRVGFMIAGIALHDVYHAGQIQLLKRLWPGT